jgi:hypothetical protein
MSFLAFIFNWFLSYKILYNHHLAVTLTLLHILYFLFWCVYLVWLLSYLYIGDGACLLDPSASPPFLLPLLLFKQWYFKWSRVCLLEKNDIVVWIKEKERQCFDSLQKYVCFQWYLKYSFFCPELYNIMWTNRLIEGRWSLSSTVPWGRCIIIISIILTSDFSTISLALKVYSSYDRNYFAVKVQYPVNFISVYYPYYVLLESTSEEQNW